MGSDPQPEDAQGPLNYRDRSSICSIFPQIMQYFREFHHWFPRGRFPADQQRGSYPPLSNGREKKRIRNQRAAIRSGWTKLGHDTIAVRDQHRFAPGRQPDVFAQLVFEQFYTDRSHAAK
jgi:hypothetical protein